MKHIYIIFILLFFFKVNSQLVRTNKNAIDIQKINKKEFDNKKNKTKIFIKYDSIRFPKINNEINLRLIKGTIIKFKDNLGVPYDENRVSYKYLGYIDVIKKYLIEVNGYEESSFLLIDTSSGKNQKIKGIPFISPSNKYFVIVFYNQYEEYNDLPPPTQDIDIYKIQNNNNFKKIISKHYKWSIKDFYWKNDNEIFVKNSSKKDSDYIDYLKLIIK